MKVLLAADAVGGVFTYALELASALASRGTEVVLATEGARLAPDQRAAVEAIPGLAHEEGAFRLEWMEEPWEDVRAAGAWLLDLERRHRPDVVHLDSYAHGALPFRAPKLVVGHSCVMSWHEAVKGIPAPASWDRYRAAVREGLRAAGAVAAPSRSMAEALVRHHGPLPAPVVIPNGRDPGRFAPAPKEELILAAGRVWDEAKNAAAVVRMAGEVPWKVCVAGETGATATEAPTIDGTAVHPEPFDSASPARGYARGRLRPPAPAEARSRRAAVLLGRLPEAELARWLSRAAIFAHPARYEPFGLAVLEAALSGCALVLGDIPSLRESWDGAAEFVPPSSDEGLAAALRALVRDPGWRRGLGERARARALEFRPERMAAAYLHLYGALRGRAGGRA